MVSTPICDFIQMYARSNALRLHMPGHKGTGVLGCEALDITEIDGADDLYHAQGIIARSEANASWLFGCPTFYSTEGSSLCIRAMLYLAMLTSKEERPLILAGRNAHKTFLHSAVVLDFDIQWLCPARFDSYHSCSLTAEDLHRALESCPRKPAALYLTSPDYLGNEADLSSLSRICHKNGILLIVDNAHGAYLRFLPQSRHPMDLGADLCCDSAHKTLPVLTGGAYLHVRDTRLAEKAKDALSLFGSTSPSYLIMQSLDAANPYLETLTEKLTQFLPKVSDLKNTLMDNGWTLCGSEELKITLLSKPYGYEGTQLADLLLKEGIVCEFSDPDYVVCMLTPSNSDADLRRLGQALCAVSKKQAIEIPPPMPGVSPVRCTPRKAAFSQTEQLPIDQCLGRILASASVGCPPAIPIIMCGEEITQSAIAMFRYYGITHCSVTHS